MTSTNGVNSTKRKVIELIQRNPNKKWWYISNPDGVTYSQYRYWAEKMVENGEAKSFDHGHNGYNRWRGYVMLMTIRDIETKSGDIPF